MKGASVNRALIFIAVVAVGTGCSQELVAPPAPEIALRGNPDLTNGGTSVSADAQNKSPEMSTPFTMPAICNPPTQSADVTDLPDDEPVIGVTVGEHSRAYVCRAMSLIHTHVINDLIEDTNIAVTFCDRTTTARVFCGPDDKGSIRMQVGGESSGAMVVNLNGVMHLQTSSRIPLQDLDFTETTWGQWKRLHPDTSVFTGQ